MKLEETFGAAVSIEVIIFESSKLSSLTNK